MSVSVRNAHKYYNKGKQNQIHVMNDISLELPESGMTAIFGVSGCGKTTLLNAIGGLDKIDGGSISLFGTDIRENPDMLRNKYIGYIFQNYYLNDNETVYENVASSLRLCGMEDEEEIKRRVTLSLEAVGMEKYKNRTPDTLSGGQMQRVAIARAVVKSPAVILADEPTGNLDENNTVLVMDMLKEISKNHLVILVTHEKDLVDFYCDKVIELVDGRIASVRENGGATGYVQKNKNDIYLGELEHEELNAGNVKIDLYGNPEDIKLRIVSRNGRLYLKCDTPSVSIIDDTSETRLVEGTFETKSRANAGEGSFNADSLGRIEGKNYGRLFRFGQSFRDSVVSFYTSRKKKGRRFLRVVLIMLSIVFIFMASFTATGIKNYFDVKESVNENEFFVKASTEKDFSYLIDHIGEHGITGFRYGNMNAERYFLFDGGAFITAGYCNLEATGSVNFKEAIKGKLVCGEIDTDDNKIVITTSFADELIASSSFSYIREYTDLLGLYNSNDTVDYFDGEAMYKYDGNAVPEYIIGGIVEDESKTVYLNKEAYADMVIDYYIAYDNVMTVGSAYPYGDNYVPYDGELNDGEIALVETGFAVNEGEKIMIYGREYTVKHVGEGLYGNFLVMTPNDYRNLAFSAGTTDKRLDNFFVPYTAGQMRRYYELYLVIKSSSPEETENYLRANCNTEFETPESIFNQRMAEYETTVIASLISLAVIVVIISLCAYFIMRSIFMPRVKEVGICRAIGVSKKNMLFRFGVESLVLTIGTVFIGYIIAGFAMSKLSSSALFSQMFYYPVWFAVILLVIITSVTVFFGLLPVMGLLRKTPSEILSKYDI